MYNILVTGVGGPTPRSFVRAVKWFGGEDGKQFRFIGADCNPLAYGLYEKALFDESFLLPRADHPQYWEKVNALIADQQIDGAIILPEVEVIEWAKNATEKLAKSIKIHLPDPRLAVELVNKHRLHEMLKDTGYIPRFYQLIPGNYSFNQLREKVGDIFWVRSTEGSSGLGSLKIESEKALEQWIAINPGVSEFIASEFLPGRNMACKLLYFNGKLLRSACAERVNYIMAKVAPSGITGNTSFGRLLNEPNLVEQSIAAIEKIAANLGTSLNGIFTVDYKEDAQGNPKITEINIRHVAFNSSIAAGGANLPMDTLTALFLKDPTEMETIHYEFEEGLIFVRDVDGYPIVMKESDLLK
jgi:carbamoyl-phosphate synthase large subunit